MIRKLIATLVLASLAACQNERPRDGIADRSTAGNGGDAVRVLLVQGRRHAIGVVERIRAEGVLDSETPWLAANLGRLRDDLAASPLVVTEAPPLRCPAAACACTEPDRFGAPIYFSPTRCVGTLGTKHQVARALVHESGHHLRGAGEAQADSLSAGVFDRWAAAGHVDSPHWMALPKDATLKHVAADGPVLVSWHGRKLRRYDLRTGERREVESDSNPRVEIDATAWAGSELLAFGRCGNPVFGHREGRSPSWRRMAAASFLSPRYDVTLFHAGDEIVLWGGKSCDADDALFDGAILDPATGRWRPIPVSGAARDRAGFQIGWVGGRLLVWGGKRRADSPALRLFPGFPQLEIVALSALDDSSLADPPAEALDPARGKWEPLASPGPVLAWTPNGHAIARPPFPSLPASAYHTAWAGDTLVALPRALWVPRHPDLALFENGVWKTFPGVAPVALGHPRFLWTGTELVTFDGERGYTLYP